jgi:hypothetical protein
VVPKIITTFLPALSAILPEKNLETKAPRKEYPIKRIVAWGEAISGNEEIRDWLTANNYPELAAFTYAINLRDDAREWLMTEGHPELMALVIGSEGGASACKWLRAHGYSKLALVAEGADNEDEAINTLLKEGHREWAMISLKIQYVKNNIQSDHDDVHRISTR